MSAQPHIGIDARLPRKSVEPGKRDGALGHIGLEVLEEFFRLVDYRTGCLDPAFATISTNIKRSYKAVHAALKRLASAGFREWMRRADGRQPRRSVPRRGLPPSAGDA